MGFLTNLIHRIFPSTVVYKHKGDEYTPGKKLYRMVDAIPEWKIFEQLPLHDKVNVIINIKPDRFIEAGQVGKLKIDGYDVGLYVERCTVKYAMDLIVTLRKLYDAFPGINLSWNSRYHSWKKTAFDFNFPTGTNAFSMFAKTYNLKHDSDIDKKLRKFLVENRVPFHGSRYNLEFTYDELIADTDALIKKIAAFKPEADEKEIAYYVSNITLLKDYLFESDDCREPWITEVVFGGEKVFAGSRPIYDEPEIRITDILWMPGTTIHLPNSIVWSHGTVMKQHVIDTIIDAVPAEYREEVRKRVTE